MNSLQSYSSWRRREKRCKHGLDNILKAERGKQFIRYKHKFNLAFVLRLACYFHKTLASTFLETVHGTNNGLLRAVSLDIKEDLYLAGCKGFGLISKIITGPLWRLLESPGHIFDMNRYCKQIIDFLLKGDSDTQLVVKFCNGTESPFNTIFDRDDKLVQSFCKEIQKWILLLLQ